MPKDTHSVIFRGGSTVNSVSVLSRAHYINLACVGRGNDRLWSICVLNGIFCLTSSLVLHTTTGVSVCIQ